MSAPVYVCPMHSDVRAPGPGTCPHCHMKLVQEGSKLGILKHMVSSPLHIAVMVAIMLAVMAAVMMMK
jgi:heavy metal-binding protein